MKNTYDLIGIGFGPANISLAAFLEEEQPDVKALFLEKRDNFVWQEEMLFENALDIHSNIQNIPHRDLATPRNPRSRYTFMNYLHEQGRLFQHLNMDLMMPMRPEYAKYIKWCADELSAQTQTGINIDSIEYLEDADIFKVSSSNGEEWHTRNVVLGHGREPSIPEQFRPHLGENVFHFTRYKSSVKNLYDKGARKIAIVGSSQTAAELLLHTTKEYEDLEVHIIMRRFAFPLKDTSPFMSEIYFPEFTDLYYKADSDLKKRIDKDVYRTNYGAADMDVIEEVYRQIYHDQLHGCNRIKMHRLSDIIRVSVEGSNVIIDIDNNMESSSYSEVFDGVVIATGFVNYGSAAGEINIPPLLSKVTQLLEIKDNSVSITGAYELETVKSSACRIFMNGLSESSHGMGDAGSLSLASLRSATIAMKILEQTSPEEELSCAV